MFVFKSRSYVLFPILMIGVELFLIYFLWKQFLLLAFLILGNLVLFLTWPQGFSGIQFENGQCFFYFNDYVATTEINAIHFFKIGWLVITNHGRYFVFLDALPREDLHELMWKMHQITRR